MNRIDQDRAMFWKHPCFHDVELLKASFIRHRYDVHTHATYVVGVITQGVEGMHVGRRWHVAPAGSIIVVNPEEPHDGEAGAEGGWSYRTCYPPVSLVREVMQELDRGEIPGFARAVIADEELARRIVRAHEFAEAEDPIDAEASFLLSLRDLILRHSDCRLGRSSPCRSASGKRLGMYREIIEAYLADRIDLALLAKSANVTRFQVVRDFKHVIGLTPGEYIRGRRVQRASDLIVRGLSLAEAASAAGFADQSHLSRTFRAIQGITPRMFKMASTRAKGAMLAIV